MEEPINKYVANDYRETLGTTDAPSFIDTRVPIMPVVDIQKGFPKPNSKQTLRYLQVNATTLTAVQLITFESNKNYYFIAYSAVNAAATAATQNIFDGTSGNGPAMSANTVYNEENGYIFVGFLPATIGTQQNFFPILPIKLKNGLRYYGGAPGASVNLGIYYIEELKY